MTKEKVLTETDRLKADVQDLLNQIVLKLKDVKKLEVESDDDGRYTVGGEEEIYDEETEDYIPNPDAATDDEKYLYSVKELCEDMAKGTAERILTKYYTSTCW